jgi:hypothetical protein
LEGEIKFVQQEFPNDHGVSGITMRSENVRAMRVEVEEKADEPRGSGVLPSQLGELDN